MKIDEEIQQLSPLETKLRILKLNEELPFKLTNNYYAKKLNRSNGAIAQALNGYRFTGKLLARINRHNDWLERKIQQRKEQLSNKLNQI